MSNNTSVVSATLYITCNKHTSYQNNCKQKLVIDGQTFENTLNINLKAGTTIALVSGSKAIVHNNDGSKSITISASSTLPYGSGWGPNSGSASANVTLSKIQRYPKFTQNPYVVSSTLDTLIFSYGAVDINSDLYYSLDNSNWTHITTQNTTIKGLNPNTNYKIYIQARNSVDANLKTTVTCNGNTSDIARIVKVDNINIGQSHTVTWSNNGKAVVTLKLCKLDGTVIFDYGTVTGTSKTITPTADIIYSLTPNSNTITLNYVLTSNNKYTSVKQCTFTVTNSNPAFLNFTYQDINATITALTGNNQILVNGYSNVKATISTANKATAKNSAIMKSYKLLIGTKNTTTNYNASADVNMSINPVNNNVIDLYAIDSRGNSTKVSKTATIKNYSNIKIKSLSATRQNNIGTITTLSFEGEFWNASFGSVANTITSCKYKYKTTSSSTWIEGKTTLTYTISGNKITGSLNVQGDAGTDGFSAGNSFDIQLILADRLSSATYNLILGAGNPAIAVYKNNVAIGQQYDTSLEKKLQINGEAFMHNNGETMYHIQRTDGNIHMGVGVGNSKNHGIFSYTANKWILNCDTSNNVYVNGIKIDTSASKKIKTLSASGNAGWISQEDGDAYLITKAFISCWNGRYNDTNSNLAYCYQGTIQAKPAVLYNNGSGTTGTVTLSQTAANFAYLEIFFGKGEAGMSSIKVPSPNGKNICLSQGQYPSAFQVIAKKGYISGTSITFSNAGRSNLLNGQVVSAGAENNILVYMVIGYR